MDFKFDIGTIKTGIEIGNILKRIDESKQIVSHETTDHYDRHDNGVLTHVYYNGTHKVLECIKPTVCHNYEPFESVCLAECTWCDNPYHCKYKNVSRETFYTIPEIWHYINFCNAMVLCPLCCTECSLITRTRCLMYDIAMDMIFETGVC